MVRGHIVVHVHLNLRYVLSQIVAFFMFVSFSSCHQSSSLLFANDTDAVARVQYYTIQFNNEHQI